MISTKTSSNMTVFGWLILVIYLTSADAVAQTIYNQSPDDHLLQDGGSPSFTSAVDETDISGSGAVDVTDFSLYFSGPASVYTLNLNEPGVGSGLYAIDPNDTSSLDGDGIGQGDEILLFHSANLVTGLSGGLTYFSLQADSSTGEVEFTLIEAIWSDDSFDTNEVMELNTVLPDDLTLIASAGGFTETMPMGQGVFFIYDDTATIATAGSIASLSAGEFDAIQLLVDESVGSQPNPVDNLADRVSVIDIQPVLSAIRPVDFGSDGSGSLTHTLSLTDGGGSPAFQGLPSGLFALDPADTSSGDGDGIGQGEEVMLYLSNGAIEGRVNSAVYFSITNNDTLISLTQEQGFNLWHPDSSNQNDAVALTGMDGSGSPTYAIVLVRVIADADGDMDSTTLNLTEANNNEYLFNFFDDAPSVNGVLSFGTISAVEYEGIQLSVDESTGQQLDPEDNVADRVSAVDYSNQFSAAAVNTSGTTAIDFGSDGPGFSDFSAATLALTDGAGAPLLTGTNSGLFGLVESSPGSGSFQQSSEIQLLQTGNTIEGQADGVTFFVIEVNESVVTLSQNASHELWHPNDTEVDEVVSLTGVADGSAVVSYQILLEATIADVDGDANPAALLLTGVIDVNGQTQYVFNFADTADDLDDNFAPNVVNDVYTAFEDITLVVDDPDGSVPGLSDDGVLVNDSDANGDVLLVDNPGSVSANGLGGLVTIAVDGTFNYVPPTDVSGQATLNVDVTDGQMVVTSLLTIDVLSVNDAPSFDYLGDVLNADLYPNFMNNRLTLTGFAFDISTGPADESGQSLAFIATITVDDESILMTNGVFLSSSGDLTLDFTGNIGFATVEVYLEDDGGKTNGGQDTSSVVTFVVSAFDVIYTDGFELP